MTLIRKIPDASELVKKLSIMQNFTGIRGRIPIITGLATTSALKVVKYKIPNVTDVVKK